MRISVLEELLLGLSMVSVRAAVGVHRTMFFAQLTPMRVPAATVPNESRLLAFDIVSDCVAPGATTTEPLPTIELNVPSLRSLSGALKSWMRMKFVMTALVQLVTMHPKTHPACWWKP